MRQRQFSQFLVISTLLLVLALCGCSDAGKTSPHDCIGDDCKRALTEALEDLNKIQVVTNDDAVQAKQRVRQIVDRFHEPRHLASLALLTRGMMGSCGGEAVCSKQSTLEPTYENAFWYCIELLAKDRSGNHALLQRLKEAAVLNDTERGDWGRIVEGKDFP